MVSASRFVSSDAKPLIAAVKDAGVPRLLVVGGAGSLQVAPGKMLIDTPEFPDAYKPEARAGVVFLDALRQEKVLNWTFLSPSALFEPGERTGKFRLGDDVLLADDEGKSWISMEDYAIALADEIETPRHTRRRFTVGYDPFRPGSPPGTEPARPMAGHCRFDARFSRALAGNGPGRRLLFVNWRTASRCPDLSRFVCVSP